MLCRDISSPDGGGVPREEEVARAARLAERIAEREKRLSPSVRSTYERLSRRHDRIVAAVLDGVCHGCFVQVPAALGRDRERHAEVRTCESCGRFLYYAE